MVPHEEVRVSVREMLHDDWAVVQEQIAKMQQIVDSLDNSSLSAAREDNRIRDPHKY